MSATMLLAATGVAVGVAGIAALLVPPTDAARAAGSPVRRGRTQCARTP